MDNNTQLFRWVNCYERVPTTTKYYSIRNSITGKDGATIYCDSNDTIMKYCAENKLDSSVIEWLEEYTPEPTATSHSVKDVEELAERSSELQEGTYTTQHKVTYKHGFIDGYKAAQSSPTVKDVEGRREWIRNPKHKAFLEGLKKEANTKEVKETAEQDEHVKYCLDCGSEDLYYKEQYACGEHWICKECGKELCYQNK